MTEFHLNTNQMRALATLLGEIPALIEDLAITLTRQDQLGGGIRISSGSDEQPLPYNVAASDAHTLLHDTLNAWAQSITTRGQQPRTTLALARWLKTHVVVLATIPGSDTAYDEIDYAMGECRRTCDKPRDPAWMTAGSEETARATELNASDIAAVARELGPEYQLLTRDRVNSLHKTGRIIPVRHFEGTPVYRLGDVMDAHVATPTRRRKKTA